MKRRKQKGKRRTTWWRQDAMAGWAAGRRPDPRVQQAVASCTSAGWLQLLSSGILLAAATVGGGVVGVGLRRKRELVKLEEKGKVKGQRERTWDVLIFKFKFLNLRPIFRLQIWPQIQWQNRSQNQLFATNFATEL